MSFPEFLEWLSRQDVNHWDADLVLEKVTLVLENLPEQDPRYAWLAVIEDKLLDGVLPKDRLLALGDRFPSDQSLEGRLRMRAGQAKPGQWETASLTRLRDCLKSWDQDPKPLNDYLAWMKSQLEAFWSEYEPTESEASSQELEKVAARLFREAYHNWQSALTSVGEGNFEGGLALAVQANQLLVALHGLEDRPL